MAGSIPVVQHMEHKDIAETLVQALLDDRERQRAHEVKMAEAGVSIIMAVVQATITELQNERDSRQAAEQRKIDAINSVR